MKKLPYILRFLLPPLKEFSPTAATGDILAYVRERVVILLIRACIMLGFPAVLIGSIAAWQSQNWFSIIIGNIAYFTVVLMGLNKRVHYRTQSYALVGVAYLYLFGHLYTELSVFTLVPLFSFVVMTTLLLGRRGGLTALLISLFSILIMNVRFNAGATEPTAGLEPFSSSFWQIAAIYVDWSFYTGIFLLVIWYFFDGFAIAWKRETEALSLLAAERNRLTEAFAREQKLLEELNQAHEREIELSRMKSQIITTVSHEFRTPLTVISNSVELLTRFADSFDEAKQQTIHKRIDDSIDYLTELLRDASLVNKAYSQGFQANIDSIPFNALSQRLKKDLLHKTHDPQNVSFEYDEADDTAVCLDYDFTYRSIHIFLTNALQYSPKASPITVKLQHNDQLTISVTDAGIGITPEETGQIWELFYRADNALDKQGMGLGLYLAKRLAQAMDGTVTAVSPGLNQGSTFTLYIPQQKLLSSA